MKASQSLGEPRRIALFGNFGLGNLGNEATLRALIYHLRRVVPNADVTCICTGPEKVAAAYGIAAVPANMTVLKPWRLRNPLTKAMRRLFVGVPSEIYRWVNCIVTLLRTDVLIIPGTGLLTDAYGVMNDWGPYSVFRWSVAAKVCRSEVWFVSVGAGPLYTVLGRLFIKTALALADFRSYRDTSSRRYLKKIGVAKHDDPIYPDLVFSLPSALRPSGFAKDARRPVVGIGVMEYPGRYSIARPCPTVYDRYLSAIVPFAEWLLSNNYDVRLLIGDTCDKSVSKEVAALLSEWNDYEENRVIDEPSGSIEELLSQLSYCEIVVATRFHNVLLALWLGKPVVAISFHQKCDSLMSDMGLEDYCLDINSLCSEVLIERFLKVTRSRGAVAAGISDRSKKVRKLLGEQYDLICERIGSRPVKGGDTEPEYSGWERG